MLILSKEGPIHMALLLALLGFAAIAILLLMVLGADLRGILTDLVEVVLVLVTMVGLMALMSWLVVLILPMP